MICFGGLRLKSSRSQGSIFGILKGHLERVIRSDFALCTDTLHLDDCSGLSITGLLPNIRSGPLSSSLTATHETSNTIMSSSSKRDG